MDLAESMMAPPSASRTFAEIDPGDSHAIRTVVDLFEGSVDAHWMQNPKRLGYAEKGLQLFGLFSGDRCDAYALTRNRHMPMVGKALYFAERGPVYRTEDAAIELIQHMRDHLSNKAWMIEVNPFSTLNAGEALLTGLTDMGFRKGEAVREHYHDTVVLDLADPIDVIRKSFRRSLKTQINRFDRSGLKASYRQDPGSLDPFCQMINNMAEDRGLKPIDAIDRSWIEDQLGQSTHLFTAELDGVFKGGILLVSSPSKSRIIYEYGGSIDESSPPLPIGHGLQWKAIQWAKDAGFRSYDFGGYDRARGDEFSINQFKLGFSKVIEPLIPELRWMPAGWLRFGLERYLSWKADRTG